MKRLILKTGRAFSCCKKKDERNEEIKQIFFNHCSPGNEAKGRREEYIKGGQEDIGRWGEAVGGSRGGEGVGKVGGTLNGLSGRLKKIGGFNVNL